MRHLLILMALLVLSAPVRSSPDIDGQAGLTLSDGQLAWVGQQVFRNECNARETCLVHWNRGEAFPSLGIGHFIWYPEGTSGPFLESFPALVAYMQAKAGDLPDWLVEQAPTGAPWPDRETFMQAGHIDPRIAELRALLAERQGIQAAFIARRARQALGRVVAASRQPDHTRRKIDALITTPGGVYALIDYVNFKGEGLAASERYEGVGWGLLQVLEAMPVEPAPRTHLDAFRDSAAMVLTRRAELSGRAIEQQWLTGWLKRIDSYREPRIGNNTE